MLRQRTGRKNRVRGHAVTKLEEDLSLQDRLKRSLIPQRHDVRASPDLHPRPLRVKDEVVVNCEAINLHVDDGKLSRVGDDALERRGGRDLRPAEGQLAELVSATAGPVAVHRAQRQVIIPRHEADADARVTARLNHSDAGARQFKEAPVLHQHLPRLTRSGRDDDIDIR